MQGGSTRAARDVRADVTFSEGAPPRVTAGRRVHDDDVSSRERPSRRRASNQRIYRRRRYAGRPACLALFTPRASSSSNSESTYHTYPRAGERTHAHTHVEAYKRARSTHTMREG